MRIIAGTFRHRRLQGPPDEKVTRPIPDSVKETVFNILRGHVEGKHIIDVFAGTGSIGLEAISRGALSVLCVEQNRQIATLLRDNIDSLDAQDQCQVLLADALGSAAIAQCPDRVHLIFFDPPYPLMLDPDRRPRVLEQLGRFIQRLDGDGYAVLRTPWPLRAHAVTPSVPHPPDATLEIQGALGPETHKLGSMAIHLYMRSENSQNTV